MSLYNRRHLGDATSINEENSFAQQEPREYQLVRHPNYSLMNQTQQDTPQCDYNQLWLHTSATTGDFGNYSCHSGQNTFPMQNKMLSPRTVTVSQWSTESHEQMPSYDNTPSPTSTSIEPFHDLSSTSAPILETKVVAHIIPEYASRAYDNSCHVPEVTEPNLSSMSSPSFEAVKAEKWEDSRVPGLIPEPVRQTSPVYTDNGINGAIVDQERELSVDTTSSMQETVGTTSNQGAGQKPGKSYAQLLYDCFMSHPNHSMTLQEIYQWFRENTDKPDNGGKGWQNSVRHNLSMNHVSEKFCFSNPSSIKLL